MLISDWSSDVCSSYLVPAEQVANALFGGRTGRRGACRLASLGLRRQLLEEISDRHPQHPGEVEQAAREDAVGAALVLLDLLQGDAERARQGFLAEPHGRGAQARAGAEGDDEGEGWGGGR